MRYLKTYEALNNDTIKEWVDIFVEDLPFDINNVTVINIRNPISNVIAHTIKFQLTLSEDESMKYAEIFSKNNYDETMTLKLERLLEETFTRFNKKYDFKFYYTPSRSTKSGKCVEAKVSGFEWSDYHNGDGDIPRTNCLVNITKITKKI